MAPKLRARTPKPKVESADDSDQSVYESSDSFDESSDDSIDELPVKRTTNKRPTKNQSIDSDDQSVSPSINELRSIIGSVSIGTCKSLLTRFDGDVEKAIDHYFSMTGSPEPPAINQSVSQSIKSPSVSQSISQSIGSSAFPYSIKPPAKRGWGNRLNNRDPSQKLLNQPKKPRTQSAKSLLNKRIKAMKGNKGDDSDDSDMGPPSDPNSLPKHQRLHSYHVSKEIDFQFKGKWFPGEVIDIHDHSYLLEVNYSNDDVSWPRECSQLIDPRSDRVTERGVNAAKYHKFEQVEVFTEPPPKPANPDQHLYDWPGVSTTSVDDESDDVSVGEMFLGSLTVEIASDRDPSRPEFYDCVVSTANDNEHDVEEKFNLMKQWFARQTSLIRVTKNISQAPQIAKSTKKPAKKTAKPRSLTASEKKRLDAKLHADPSYIAVNRWMKLGRNPVDICLSTNATELDDEILAHSLSDIRDMLVSMDEAELDAGLESTILRDAMMFGDDSDDCPEPDSDDCGSMTLSLTNRSNRSALNRTMRSRVAAMGRRAYEMMSSKLMLKGAHLDDQNRFLESALPIQIYTLKMDFYVQSNAQASSPQSTNLSLTPLNGLMKFLFPDSPDLLAKIAEAEAERHSTLSPTLKLDKLMECAVRDEHGLPFYYETKRLQTQSSSMSTDEDSESQSSSSPSPSSVSVSQPISRSISAPSALAESAVESLPVDEDELLERCETISQQCDLSITLRDYQVHTVQWMLAQERDHANTNMYIWSQLRFRAEETDEERDEEQELPLFFYSPLLQRFRFRAMPNIKGGFNCEEMGLGKTIGALAVINSERQTNEEKRRAAELNNSQSTSSSSLSPSSSLNADDDEYSPSPEITNKRSRKRKARTDEVEVDSNSDARDSMDRHDNTGRVYTGATLVVAPVSLVGQWASELIEKSTRPLKVCLFYGGSRPRTVEKLLNYDVIITSYGVASSELNLGNNRAKKLIEETPWKYHGKHYPGYQSLMSQLHFHRIILDESHTIRVSSNTTARAAYEFIGDRRWLLSGTPVNTSLLDLRGQLEFLEVQGLIGQVWKDTDNILVQNKEYPRQGQRKSPGRLALRSKKRLCNLFTNIVTKSMIRHEKKQPFNGRSALIVLPPKSVTTVLIEPNADERKALDLMYKHAKARFEDYKSIGVAVRRSIEVLQLLQPLRIACSGGTVDMQVHRERMRAELERDAVRTVIEKFREKDSMNLDAITEVATAIALNSLEDSCSICLDLLQQPVQTKCRHLFCGECLRSLLLANRGALKGTGLCPLCRATLSIDELFAPNFGEAEEEEEGTEEEESDRPLKKVKREPVDDSSIVDQSESAAAGVDDEKKDENDEMKVDDAANDDVPDVVSFTSKTNTLFAEIEEMHRASPTYKALIFTQYIQIMDLLKKEFASRGTRFETLEGHMTMQQRKKNLDTFRKDPECTVFLLSMRAGAVGLTLTAASHVFILEPAVNPATEQQAIGRIHRLGNVHPQVTVKYLVMKGTVEEKLMALNREKMATIEKQQTHNDDEKSSNDQTHADSDSNSDAEEQPRFGRHQMNANIDSSGAGVNAVSLGSLQNDVAMFRLSELNKLFA